MGKRAINFKNCIPQPQLFKVTAAPMLLKALLLSLLLAISPAFAKGTSHSSTSSSTSHSAPASSGHSTAHSGGKAHTSTSSQHSSAKADAGVQRDANGKIARSGKAKDDFKKQHPCPSTGRSSGACPGYVIDHKQALKHGGADAPSNMQWQTKEAAKEKDKWE